MPAGRPKNSAEQRALRIKAYEMWLHGALNEGQRVSMRGIAMALGVTISAVQYWRTTDMWDAKVNAALTQHTLNEVESTSNLANLLRASLYENMKVLNSIIRDKQGKPLIRIKAISEYADICHKLKVVQAEDLQKSLPAALAVEFKDDLDGNVRGYAQDASTASDAASAASHDGTDNHVHDDSRSHAEPGPLGSPDGGREYEPNWSGSPITDGEPGRDERLPDA